jgi:hypothetical protein
MIATLVRGPFLAAVIGACLLLHNPAAAQALPPLTPDRLNQAADRIEALVILGGDYAASGGVYRFRGNGDFDLSVDKLGGGGDVGTPRPLGQSTLKWNPLITGNIGYTSATVNAPGALTGNTVDVQMLGLNLGMGARFWFNDQFSMAPSMSAIYGHTTQTFNALNATGEHYLSAMEQAGWVNWSLDTWSAIPTLDAKYKWSTGRINLYLQSTFKYFHTEDAKNSSAVDLSGNSQTWGNTLDVDIPLDKFVFGHELHTGGHLDQLEIFGNARTGLDTDHIYTVNARLVVDMVQSYAFLSWLGLGASYYWSDNLSGWSVGISARLIL